MCNDFCHLHVHTEMSLLDGLGTPSDLIGYAKSLGQRGIAITDHGNMHGVIDFFRTAKAHDMIPIIGCEVYQTPFGVSRFEKNASNRTIRHSLIISENDDGYHNLVKLSSLGYLEGFYTKPRIDYQLLEQYKSGLIVTSGCMAAELPQLIMNGAPDSSLNHLIDWYINVIGKDNYYIELQHHDNIPEIPIINKKLIQLSKNHGVKLIVTNDVHYAKQSDAKSHDVLLCVQTRAKIDDVGRFKFSSDDYYIKTRHQLEKDFADYGIDSSAFDNTIEIMERCSGVNLESQEKHHMPNIEIKTGAQDYDQELRNLIKSHLPKYKEQWGPKKQEVTDRIKYEMQVIEETGFSVYYLIIYDICNFAKNNNIIWNIRGSGAGSIVSYILGMSFVDPMEYGLLFERFLNPVRVSTPDFDIDFPDNLREPIISHIISKYGEDNVAQIITFGRMKARMCIRDVGRVYKWPQAKSDDIANRVLNIPGKPITINNSLDENSEYYSSLLKKAYDTDDEVAEVIDICKTLEKTARHTGVHAAAIAISDKPLIEYVPLTRGNQTTYTKHVTQFDYPTLESLGILKVDVLGLSTLTIVNKCLELIEKRTGINYRYELLPFDPSIHDTGRAYELLISGEVAGVFQVESHGLRNILIRLKPTTFQQVMDVISLYRPGPMDYISSYIARAKGEESIEYRDESLRPILEKTQGIMIYQEQIMKVLQVVGGYTLAEADIVRKAISKKDQEKIQKERKHFTENAVKNGYAEDTAYQIFDDIEKFALYGFNMAHAASYARMTVVTSWLKSMYPLEYMAASMVVESQKIDKVARHIQECDRMGIAVVPPDIQKSDVGFSIEDENSGKNLARYAAFNYNLKTGAAIRFGFDSIKQVGDDAAKYLAKIAKEKSISTQDDIYSIDHRIINSRSLRRICAAGVFDSILPRYRLVGNENSIIEFCKQASDVYYTGQYYLVKPSIDLPDRFDSDLIHEEKESLGIWLTDHPVQEYYRKYPSVYTDTIYDIINDESGEDRNAVMILAINDIKTITSRDGKPMAFLQCSDFYGSIEGVIFSRVYEECPEEILQKNKIIIAHVKISYKKTEPSLIINKILNSTNESEDGDDLEKESEVQNVKIIVDNKIEFLKWAKQESHNADGKILTFRLYDKNKNAVGKHQIKNSSIYLSKLRMSKYIYAVEDQNG